MPRGTRKRKHTANELDTAVTMFAKLADPWLVQKAHNQVNRGALRWRIDPEYPNVVGLVTVDDPNEAVVVVYIKDEDFEVNTEWAGH